MTDDRIERLLPELMHELAGRDERYIEDILARTSRTRQRSAWTFVGRWLPAPGLLDWLPAYQARLVVLLLLVATLVLLLGTAAFIGSQSEPDPPTSQVTNGWIAFSTQPGHRQVWPNDRLSGGDIYLVRQGVRPILIAGRGEDMKSNVCPAFSHDGSMLVYGERAGPDRALIVLGVAVDGATSLLNRINVPGSGLAPCPRWSADGTRVAYLTGQGPGPGMVAVRGLDGSALAPADGDPSVADFSHITGPLLSPGGEWTTHDGPCCDVVISRPDGSDRRVIKPLSNYAIQAFSPDGRYLLTMRDVSGRHFEMWAWSVEGDPSEKLGPSEGFRLVSSMLVNGTRSWPGRGDVSWQPVYP